MHIICTICNDVVNHAETLYVTKCGHLFHHHCLSQWLDRSRTCPQCRASLSASCVRRVFPTVAETPHGEDAASLQAQLDDARLAVRQHEATARQAEQAAAEAAQRLAAAQEEAQSEKKRALRSECALSAAREQLHYVRAQCKDNAALRADNTLLTDKLNTLHNLQKVVEASAEEVDTMLEAYSDARTIAVFATAFKRAVGAAEKARRAAEGRLSAARAALAVERARTAFLTNENTKLKELAATEPRRISKRKSGDSESSLPLKQSRNEPEVDLTLTTTEADATTAAVTENDVSLGTLVARIEAADSPYWTLRSAAPTLSLQPKLEAKGQQAATSAASNRENRAAAANKAASSKFSIFHNKPAPNPLEYFSLSASLEPDVSYDGLGGHSKPDVFPQPRSYAPKLTAKHKLSRKPTAQDIGAMIQRINSKKQ